MTARRGRKGSALRSTVLMFAALCLVLFLSAMSLLSTSAFPGENGKIVFVKDTPVLPGIYFINPDGSGVNRLSGDTDREGLVSLSPDGRRILFISVISGSTLFGLMNSDGTGRTMLPNVQYLGSRFVWSPDGSRFAHSNDVNGEIVLSDGSEDTPLKDDKGNFIRGLPLAWSPDGGRIAYRPPYSGTAVIGTDGTGGTLLALPAAVQYTGHWSPDWTRILYGGGSNSIDVVNADGTGSHRVAEYGIAPSWAPDSQRIGFVAGDGLHVINADGTGDRLLSRVFASSYSFTVAWSPDGTKIAFGEEVVRIINVDGTEEKLISYAGSKPAWFPDGRRIAFSIVGASLQEIFAMDGGGGAPTRLVAGRLATYNGYTTAWPAWSPDGAKLAFMTGHTPDLALQVVKADGSGRTTLPTVAFYPASPAWSPDGLRLLYSGGSPSRAIWSVGADGVGAKRFSGAGGFISIGNVGDPAWSPNGCQIAYRSPVGADENGNAYYGIAVVNPDGSGATDLTTGPDDASPAWSPDGSKIAFTRYVTESTPGRQVWTMKADGSEQRVLVTSGSGWQPWFKTLPTWSPDGTKIAFSGPPADATKTSLDYSGDIYVVSASGGTPTPITSDGYSTDPDWQPLRQTTITPTCPASGVFWVEPRSYLPALFSGFSGAW